jgi:hypothetical protein
LRFCGAPQNRKYAPSMNMRSLVVQTPKTGRLEAPDGA